MSNVTELHLALILLLAFSLFGLAAELLYLLHCRRRRRRIRCQSPGLAVDPELQGDSGADNGMAPTKQTLFHALCFKKQPSSRVEPAFSSASPMAKPAPVAALAERETVEAAASASAGEEDEEDCDLARWREMCLGPSRALYTIAEEEDAGHSATSGDQEACHADDDDDCHSVGTSFYTPSSSPPRASE